jgi:hypothetical protein
MALLLAGTAMPLHAQRLAGRWAKAPRTVVFLEPLPLPAGGSPTPAPSVHVRRPALPQDRSTGRLVVGGLVGGIVGGALGGAVGAGLWGGIDPGGCSYEEWVCRVHGFYWGAVVGESLGIPMGIHLANGRRGDLLRSTLVSAALGAVGSLAIVAAGFDPPLTPILLVTVPVAQLTTSTILERRTTR